MSIKAIIERLFRQYHPRRFRIDEVVPLVVEDIFGYDPIEAEEYVRVHRKKIWNYVSRRVDEEKSKRLYPTFINLDPDRYEISWYPAEREDDTDELRELKRRLGIRGDVLTYIDAFDSREYEAIGCLICQLAGSNRWYLTPGRDEFGVDFVALVPVEGRTHLFPSVNGQIRIVGQAKKWNTRVERSVIQGMSDVIGDVLARSPDLTNILPDWFFAAGGPVIGWVCGHKGVQSGGMAFADTRGIVVSDSRDLAQIVALHGEWDEKENVCSFIRRSVDGILTSSVC